MGKIRVTIPALIALSLVACGQPATETNGDIAGGSTAPPPAVAPAPAPPIGGMPQSLPPQPETTPRFVGLWATSPNLCAEPAWRFEADEVSTRGEVHCDFTRVLASRAGYSVAATCTAEGPPTPQQIEIGFAESARSMTLMGGPWGHASLVYCGPITED